MNWSIEIERVDNGYVAKWWTEDGDEQPTVFEEADTKHGEIEAFQRLLWFITEHFGMAGSKHDERRIRITTGGEDEDN